MSVGVEEYCRLCARLCSEYVNIFEEVGKRHFLFLKIVNNLNIVLSENDPLTKYVCILCTGKLDFTEKFKRQCQTAQLSLRRILKERQSSQVCSTGVITVKNKSSNCDTDVKELLKNDSFIYKLDDADDLNSSDNEDKTCTSSKSVIITVNDDNSLEENTILDVKMEVEEMKEVPSNDSYESKKDDNFDESKIDVSVDDDNKTNDVASNDLKGEKPIRGGKQMFYANSNDDKIIDDRIQIDDQDDDDSISNNPDDNYRFEQSDKQSSSVGCGDNFDDFTRDDSVDDNDDDDASENMKGEKQKPDENEMSVANRNENKKDDNRIQSDDQDDNNSSTCINPDDSFQLEQSNKQSSSGKYEDNLSVQCEDVSTFFDSRDAVTQDNGFDESDGSSISLYFRYSEKRLLNNTTEYTRHIIPYLICLLENKSSIMPYFLHMKDSHGGGLWGMRFKCLVCCGTFIKRLSIMIHLTQHLYLNCNICDKKWFHTQDAFKIHFLRNHRLDISFGKLKCKFCDKVFKSVNSYIEHAPCNFQYSCSLCSFKTKVGTQWISHVNHKHKKERKNCVDCGFFYNNKDGLMRHLSKIKRSGFVCKSCGMVFHTEEYLYLHYQIYGENHGSTDSENNEAAVFVDETEELNDTDKASCSTAANSKDTGLQERILFPSKTTDARGTMITFFRDILDGKVTVDQLPTVKVKKFGKVILGIKCPECSLGFSIESFVFHVQSHVLKTCYRCKVIFKDFTKFLNHFKSHSSNTQLRLLKCTVCRNQTQFKNIGAYIAHAKSHNYQKACKHCGDVILSANEMRHHVRTFHNKAVCEHCGKVFTRKDTLKSHILDKHSTDPESLMVCPDCGKQFRGYHRCGKIIEKLICAYCSKRFSSKGGLIPHIAVHMNQLGHKCDLCGKKFNRRTSLKKHLKDMHSSVRKWKCTVYDCRSSYSFKSALVKHMKVSHNL